MTQKKLDDAISMRDALNNAMAKTKIRAETFFEDVDEYEAKLGKIKVTISTASKELEAAKTAYKKTVGK